MIFFFKGSYDNTPQSHGRWGGLIATAKARLRKRIEGDPFIQCQAVYEEVIKEIREEIGRFNMSIYCHKGEVE